MQYVIGVTLAAAVALFATVVGLARERSFYATVLIVVGSYYVLFAAMGASSRTLIAEVGFAIFLLFAVLGFKRNLWVLAAALIGHGIFDLFHHLLIDNPGVPRWWPGFCLAFDAPFGVLLALRLIRQPRSFDAKA